MRNSIIAFIIFTISYSCIDDYDLKHRYDDPRLVVEGVITNQNGPYFISLTKSRLGLTYDPYGTKYDPNSIIRRQVGVERINDAEVYITDKTESVTDTLIKSWTLFRNTPLAYDSTGYFGLYQTKKIKGIPGHTYSLTVKWQNKEYHAECFMPPLPPMDSVQFNFNKGEVGKSDFNIPLLYFKEPQNEQNYYLFMTPGNDRVWPYSILSDEYLKEYVNGLDVCKGVAPDYWMNAYPREGMMDYFIEMHSLTKEGYDYYKALIQMFRTDGGGYSPSPASPPTNMDNGALGFFRASAVNRVDFKAQRPKEEEIIP